ncbi:MAG: hypothetical protein RL094_501 [Candidatus Parcubacteria bacterium]|jgi:phosphohistidine swiveling domain-containing protein
MNQKITQATHLQNMGSRERSLIYALVLSKGDRCELKQQFGIDVTILVTGEGTTQKITTWYSADELKKVSTAVQEKVKNDPSFNASVKIQFDTCWQHLMTYVRKEKVITTPVEAYNLYETYWKWWSALSFTLDASHISEDIQREYQSWRVEHEKYTEDIDALFIEYISTHMSQYAHVAHLITPEELLHLDNEEYSAQLQEEIELRKHGYVLFNEEVYPAGKLESIIAEHNLILEQEEVPQDVDYLNGVIASKGRVTGKARIIKYKSELHTVQEGEILIAEATTPDYLTAIKKAAAIVTDEGGMMSHAAITCRELKKVCIVGTALATKVFKTGELVEVVAEEGRGTIRRV